MLGNEPELAKASLQDAVLKKQEVNLKQIIEILNPFEVFSELVSLDKKITMNHVVSQLYIIRTELIEIQQKHFWNTLVQEVVDYLLIRFGGKIRRN